MKKVNFTAEEAAWLIKLLLQRISLHNETSLPKPKVINNCISAMFKLEEEPIITLKDWEKTMCVSVVNESLPFYYNQVEVSDAFSLVTMNEEQRMMLEYIDMGKSILKKLNTPKSETLSDHNLNTFYRDKYTVLAKLKACELIYISRAEENNINKIGFVYQGREASVYKLNHKVRPDDLMFYALKMDAVRYGNQHFSLLTDRIGALEMLSRCDESRYPINQLMFLKLLLN